MVPGDWTREYELADPGGTSGIRWNPLYLHYYIQSLHGFRGCTWYWPERLDQYIEFTGGYQWAGARSGAHYTGQPDETPERGQTIGVRHTGSRWNHPLEPSPQ